MKKVERQAESSLSLSQSDMIYAGQKPQTGQNGKFVWIIWKDLEIRELPGLVS